MKLKTWLEKQGLQIPEKKETPILNSESAMLDNLEVIGANEMHDQWANIEIPEDSNLKKLKFLLDCILENSISCKKTGDLHSILLNDLDHIRGLTEDAIRTIYSLLPERKKVMADRLEELACLCAGAELSTFKNLTGEYKESYMKKAKAIAAFINKEDK